MMPPPLDFFKALGVGIFIVIMIGWVLFMILYVLRFLFKELRYKLKKWKEEDVEWCMDAIDQGLDEVDVRTILLTDPKFPNKRVKEIVYLFKKCEKKLKGGKEKNE